jgi:hypothetical protein
MAVQKGKKSKSSSQTNNTISDVFYSIGGIIGVAIIAGVLFLGFKK